MNSSGSPPSDLALVTTADKAVKAILPFLKEISKDGWWTGLLAAWIDFEDKGPAKYVSSFLIYLVLWSQLIYYSDCQLTIAMVKLLYG